MNETSNYPPRALAGSLRASALAICLIVFTALLKMGLGTRGLF